MTTHRIQWAAAVLGILLIAVPGGVAEQSDEPFSSYIETGSRGWIDWSRGVIYGVGRGYMDLHNNSRAMAMRSAHVMALQSILQIAAGIRLDDRRTLEALGKGPVVIDLKALIRFTEHRRRYVTGNRPHYEITLRAPLTGIEGLQSRLLEQLKGTPDWDALPLPDTGPVPDDPELPWVVLDARQLPPEARPQPALFPAVVTASGDVLYHVTRVRETALRQRGMARYVVSDAPADRLRTRAAPDDGLRALVSRLMAPNAALAQDAAPPRRQKRARYIVKEVQAAQGLARTHLVISEKDARELRSEDAASRILKECRVIVILASPMGGTEGALPFLFASRRGAGM